MKSKVFKIGTVLLVFVCLVSFLTFSVSADAAITKGLSFTGAGYFTNTGTGSKFVPNSSNSNAVYPDNSVFNNAVSLWFSYDNIILNSGQYGYQDLWIDPFEIGSYTMTFAVDYSSYFISDIVIHSDNQKFTNGYYQTIGTKTVNGKTYHLVKFSFNVSTVESNNGLTGGYIRIGLGARNSNITTFGAFVIDITANTSTGQILENQQQNTQSIIDNQNKNAQTIIEEITDNKIDIIDSQNRNAQQQIAADKENTDKIINGWVGADSVDDGTADDFANAEDAALGGKSDDEIQSEINNALNFDIGVFDTVKVGKIHSLFDDVLNATGAWQSLFVLSLTLGLGAFLIGRRYG